MATWYGDRIITTTTTGTGPGYDPYQTTSAPTFSPYLGTTSPNFTVTTTGMGLPLVGCSDNHQLDAIRPIEGGFEGVCVHCGARVRMEAIPAGLPAILMRRLLEAAAAGEWESDDYASLVTLREQLKAEKEALDLAFAEMGVLESILSDQ